MPDKAPLRINTGGMYRCCIKHLEDDYLETSTYSPQDGETKTCPYCKSTNVCQGGVWSWQEPATRTT